MKGDFERFKAAGATVIRELYNFPGHPTPGSRRSPNPDDNYFQLVSPMG